MKGTTLDLITASRRISLHANPHHLVFWDLDSPQSDVFLALPRLPTADQTIESGLEQSSFVSLFYFSRTEIDQPWRKSRSDWRSSWTKPRLMETNRNSLTHQSENYPWKTICRSSNQHKILAVINPVIWYHMIRITPMILEFCPDLSQRVNRIYRSSNHAMNVTRRRGTNPTSNMKRINTPQTWAW
jgi:hypothetical protein